MTYEEEARNFNDMNEIAMSCRVIKSHASFVGVAAERVVSMPETYVPSCMDELNEAAGVLQRALGRIERAKETLLAKMPAEAAE